MPFVDEGSMGSATDGDEDAVTGLIYLAELLDLDEAREYAVKSIAAFVLEDIGLAAPERNSQPAPRAAPERNADMVDQRAGPGGSGGENINHKRSDAR